MTLTYRIVIGMMAGLAVGLLLQWFALPKEHVVSEFLTFGLIEGGGEIFISLLRMMVVPLVLVSLTCGAASLGATGRVGRLGGKAIGLYLVTTALAVSLALSLALIVDPGLDAGEVADVAYEAREAPSIKDTFVNIVPKNPIAAMADGAMLQIILFALLLGFSISQVGEAGARIQNVQTAIHAVLRFFTYTGRNRPRVFVAAHRLL